LELFEEYNVDGGRDVDFELLISFLLRLPLLIRLGSRDKA
jgi:hypothetical protein